MSEYAQTAHKNIIIKNSTFPAIKIKATDDKATLVPWTFFKQGFTPNAG